MYLDNSLHGSYPTEKLPAFTRSQNPPLIDSNVFFFAMVISGYYFYSSGINDILLCNFIKKTVRITIAFFSLLSAFPFLNEFNEEESIVISSLPLIPIIVALITIFEPATEISTKVVQDNEYIQLDPKILTLSSNEELRKNRHKQRRKLIEAGEPIMKILSEKPEESKNNNSSSNLILAKVIPSNSLAAQSSFQFSHVEILTSLSLFLEITLFFPDASLLASLLGFSSNFDYHELNYSKQHSPNVRDMAIVFPPRKPSQILSKNSLDDSLAHTETLHLDKVITSNVSIPISPIHNSTKNESILSTTLSTMLKPSKKVDDSVPFKLSNTTGSITGSAIGNITGSATGNITGNATEDIIGNATEISTEKHILALKANNSFALNMSDLVNSTTLANSSNASANQITIENALKSYNVDKNSSRTDSQKFNDSSFSPNSNSTSKDIKTACQQQDSPSLSLANSTLDKANHTNISDLISTQNQGNLSKINVLAGNKSTLNNTYPQNNFSSIGNLTDKNYISPTFQSTTLFDDKFTMNGSGINNKKSLESNRFNVFQEKPLSLDPLKKKLNPESLKPIGDCKDRILPYQDNQKESIFTKFKVAQPRLLSMCRHFIDHKNLTREDMNFLSGLLMSVINPSIALPPDRPNNRIIDKKYQLSSNDVQPLTDRKRISSVRNLELPSPNSTKEHRIHVNEREQLNSNSFSSLPKKSHHKHRLFQDEPRKGKKPN